MNFEKIVKIIKFAIINQPNSQFQIFIIKMFAIN